MSADELSRFERYRNTLDLGETVAEILARDEALSAFFDQALTHGQSPQTLANIVANDVAREIKEKGEEKLLFTPDQVAELAAMIHTETISGKTAKEVFEVMARDGESPAAYVEARNLRQISDPAQIVPLVKAVIAEHPGNVAKYRDGNERLFGFFVGQVLKATGGKANPKIVNELVLQALKG